MYLTQDAPVRTIDYDFIPATIGEYILEFRWSPTDFISVAITVN